jgi:hypothetical protein
MTPVQVNWLTLVLAPLAVVGLAVALTAARSAARKGEQPGAGGGIQRGAGDVLARVDACRAGP